MEPGWAVWLDELARARRVTTLPIRDARLWITAERLPQFSALWPNERDVKIKPGRGKPLWCNEASARKLWHRKAARASTRRWAQDEARDRHRGGRAVAV